jgi:tetratricopeptide (TPR) repeat protein
VSGAPASLPRLDLHQRVQHALLALFVLAALASGLMLGPGAGHAARFAPGVLGRLHLLGGATALAILVYHGISLLVIAYLEGGEWADFPMRLGAEDAAAAGAELGFLLGRRPERPEADEFRVSQKAMYWGTAALLAGAGVTGAGLVLWDRLGTLGSLSLLADIHRGCALLLLGALLWHLYGAFVRDGAWSPEWSWVTGRMDTGRAAQRVQGFHRRRLREEEEREASLHGRGREEAEEERRLLEVEEVQAALALGNQLALEEKFVDALYHYRRALELYPGYAQARYNMARVLARMGERAMAREAYAQFIESDPFHPLAGKAREALAELDGEERR